MMPKININGVTREMTAEELAELERTEGETPAEQLALEERLSALEQENKDLKEALTMLLEGVTEDG